MDSAKESSVPLPFRRAVDGLKKARLRQGIEIDPTKPPQRLAPYAYALEAAVVDGEDDLADGRLILLHDPSGHDAWQGTFRLVTLVRAELEPEMAADPLLPEVCWSWLTGALEARGLTYGEPSGTVTMASSHYFGGLSERRPATQIEIRASWTPREGWAGCRTPRPICRPGASCCVKSRGCRRSAPRTPSPVWCPCHSGAVRTTRSRGAGRPHRGPRPGLSRGGVPGRVDRSSPHRSARTCIRCGLLIIH